jgi:hypothetical protein
VKYLRLSALLLVTICTVSAPVLAQDQAGTDIDFGVRAGYTNWDDIDQAHFGVQLNMGEVLPNVMFRPNFEISLGDAANIYIFNADVAYSFTEFVASPWNLYGGGAFSINWVKRDGIGTDSSIGLNAMLGLEYELNNGHEALVEMRFGLKESPDFKLTFGYTLF